MQIAQADAFTPLTVEMKPSSMAIQQNTAVNFNFVLSFATRAGRGY